jgi:hypothetical protein
VLLVGEDLEGEGCFATAGLAKEADALSVAEGVEDVEGFDASAETMTERLAGHDAGSEVLAAAAAEHGHRGRLEGGGVCSSTVARRRRAYFQVR